MQDVVLVLYNISLFTSVDLTFLELTMAPPKSRKIVVMGFRSVGESGFTVFSRAPDRVGKLALAR